MDKSNVALNIADCRPSHPIGNILHCTHCGDIVLNVATTDVECMC